MELGPAFYGYFALIGAYRNMFAPYRQCWFIRDLDPNGKELAIHSEWQSPHYSHHYNVGPPAIRIVV